MSGPASRAGRQPLGRSGLAAVSWRVAVASAVGASSVALLAAVASKHGALLFDFRGDLYNAGRDILHGRDPYRSGFLSQLAAIKRGGGSVNPTFAVPVYPAPTLVAVAPLALLPFWLSGVLFTCASAAAIVTALRLLGVRDWRCTVLALVSWPSLFGLYLGTLDPILLLGIALAWRLRRNVAGAAALAGTIAGKLFPWPLLLWPVLTKRWRSFMLSLVLVVVALLGAWAVIDFHGLGAYPGILSDLSFVERGRGVSMTSVLISLGLSPQLAQAAALGASGMLVFGAWRIASHRQTEERAFGLIVLAALLASPLVWEHYLVLLLVPIALISPRLSPIWFVPALSGLIPTANVHSPPEMLFWLGLQLVVLARVLWPEALSLRRSGRVGAEAKAARA